MRYKNYGLGKDNFWALANHKIIKELGYTPPKAEIHTFKYEHEKACADVFVTLYLTGKLYDWEAHKKIAAGIIPDRSAEVPGKIYLEIEMGSKSEIRQKAEKYRQYYFGKREDFKVWFLVKESWQYDQGLEDLRHFSQHYSIELIDEFHQKFSDTHSDTYSD